MADPSEGSSEAGRFALWPLRLGVAAVFLVFGWNKFTNLSGTEAMFEAWGIPLAGTAVLLVAIAEFFGGIGLLLGVFSRFSAAVLSLVMVTAIGVVTFEMGFVGGWALDLALLTGLLTIVVNGPGRPTLCSALDLGVLDPSEWIWERITTAQREAVGAEA